MWPSGSVNIARRGPPGTSEGSVIVRPPQALGFLQVRGQVIDLDVDRHPMFSPGPLALTMPASWAATSP